MSETTTSTETVTATNENRPTLTLQDLTLVMQVIETGTERGAWKAGELASVGNLYDRILAFLTAAGAIQPKQEEEKETQ